MSCIGIYVVEDVTLLINSSLCKNLLKQVLEGKIISVVFFEAIQGTWHDFIFKLRSVILYQLHEDSFDTSKFAIFAFRPTFRKVFGAFFLRCHRSKSI